MLFLGWSLNPTHAIISNSNAPGNVKDVAALRKTKTPGGLLIVRKGQL